MPGTSLKPQSRDGPILKMRLEQTQGAHPPRGSPVSWFHSQLSCNKWVEGTGGNKQGARLPHRGGRKLRMGDSGKTFSGGRFPVGNPKPPQTLWVGGGSLAVSCWAYRAARKSKKGRRRQSWFSEVQTIKAGWCSGLTWLQHGKKIKPSVYLAWKGLRQGMDGTECGPVSNSLQQRRTTVFMGRL